MQRTKYCNTVVHSVKLALFIMIPQYFGYLFVCSFSVGQEGKRQFKRKTKQECPQLGKAVNCILNCAFFSRLDVEEFSINKSRAIRVTLPERNHSPWLIKGGSKKKFK